MRPAADTVNTHEQTTTKQKPKQLWLRFSLVVGCSLLLIATSSTGGAGSRRILASEKWWRLLLRLFLSSVYSTTRYFSDWRSTHSSRPSACAHDVEISDTDATILRLQS